MRRLLGVLGVVVIIGSLLYVLRPAGHVPLYDANLTRLAETARQGWCSGVAFVGSNGVGDAEEAAACRANSYINDDYAPWLALSEFCEVIAARGGYGITAYECVAILEQARYWPTYDGALTGEWNHARKFPGDILGTRGGEVDDSRTGGREPTVHEGPRRGGPGASTGPTGPTAAGATGATGSTGG